MQPAPSFKVRITKNYSPNDGDQYSGWIRSVNATLGLLRSRPLDSSTYRVPAKLRAREPRMYTPQMISIGPFHRDKPWLRAMEEFKWRYMLAFLDRVVDTDLKNNQINSLDGKSSESSPEMLALNKLCNAVSGLEEMARAWYAEDINLDKHQLVEMLLVDGCFILELFYTCNLINIKKANDPQHISSNQDEEEESHVKNIKKDNDPQHISSKQDEQVPFESLARNHSMITTLTHDLMLLENQIPYIILQQLFDMIPSSKRISTGTDQELSLQEHVLCFFHTVPMLQIKVSKLDRHIKDTTFTHLLDLLYHVCNISTKITPSNLIYRRWGLKRCATELNKSGIQFINDKEGLSIVDIKFSQGEISIPPLILETSSGTLLSNLIALEQTRSGRQVISSYVILMSTLIRSRKDAFYLLEKGIIQTPIYYNNISRLFANLCAEVVISDFCYKDLCKEIENYKIPFWSWQRMKSSLSVTWIGWKESMKDLRRDYFRNRWSLIAFSAACFVIILSLVQTFYTVRAYYPPYH